MSTAKRSVIVDLDLTATCDGKPAARLTSIDDGVLQIDVQSSAMSQFDSLDSRKTFRDIRMVVAGTGQTVQVAVDGTPALRFVPQTTATGQTVARLKVIKLTKLISVVLNRFRRGRKRP